MAVNEISNQEVRLDARRLTSDNLSSIPRRNNLLFLSDYVQRQHSYAKEYASKGLSTFSRDLTASPTPKIAVAQGPSALDDFLLGTPVLKPRAPVFAPVERSTILGHLKATGDSAKNNGDQSSVKFTTGSRITKLVAQDNPIGGSFSREERPREGKKRTEDERGSGFDEEYPKRLRARRERKRLRKDIMRSPASGSRSEKENSKRCTRKGGKNDKTKTQASFALIHGFTATNVGKSRITLDPILRNVGVFKKGKASRSLKIGTSKQRNGHDVCFSEARFLKSANTKPNKIVNIESSSISSSSGKNHKQKVALKHNEKPTNFKKITEIDNEASESAEDLSCGNVIANNKVSPTPEDRRPYDPANSITWDIERESYVEESEANCHQGTIVLKFPCDVVAEEKQEAVAETPVVRTSVWTGSRPDIDSTSPKISDDSLHPSQSASQLVREQPTAQEIGNHEQPTLSKYFTSANIVTTEDVHKRRGSFEGRQSMTWRVSESQPDKKSDTSMVRRSPPRTEARWVSPTLSQMLSLEPVDGFPHSYDTFSLADVRNVFEDTKMELEACRDFHGPDLLPEPDFWPRSNDKLNFFEPDLFSMQHYMLENLDNSFVSGNFMDCDFKDPPALPVEDDCCCLPDELPDESCQRRNDAYEEVAFSDCSVDLAGYVADLGNDAFSRIAPSYLPILSTPSAVGSSEDDVCFSPTRVDHFSQGRSLLYGLDHGSERVSDAEAEVAKLLKQNHWLPHRL